MTAQVIPFPAREERERRRLARWFIDIFTLTVLAWVPFVAVGYLVWWWL